MFSLIENFVKKEKTQKKRKTSFFEKMHAAHGTRVLSIYHMRWAPLAMVSARNRVPSIYHMRWAPKTRFFDAHSDQKLWCFSKKTLKKTIKRRFFKFFAALCEIL